MRDNHLDGNRYTSLIARKHIFPSFVVFNYVLVDIFFYPMFMFIFSKLQIYKKENPFFSSNNKKGSLLLVELFWFKDLWTEIFYCLFFSFLSKKLG